VFGLFWPGLPARQTLIFNTTKARTAGGGARASRGGPRYRWPFAMEVRMKRLPILVLLAAGTLLAPGVAAAGGDVWAGFGVGGGYFAGGGGLAGHVDVGWLHGKNVVSGRIAAVADEGECILCQTRGDRIDMALVLGRQWSGVTGLGSIAAGVGYVKGQNLPGSTLGLALEARAIGRVGRHVGLGLYAFGNVNSKDSFFGLTLALRLGGM